MNCEPLGNIIWGFHFWGLRGIEKLWKQEVEIKGRLVLESKRISAEEFPTRKWLEITLPSNYSTLLSEGEYNRLSPFQAKFNQTNLISLEYDVFRQFSKHMFKNY
jgi:hypothetical protein